MAFVARRLQPEPTCTWHKHRQPGMKRLPLSLSITTQCNERLHNTTESGSVDFRSVLKQIRQKVLVRGEEGNNYSLVFVTERRCEEKKN